MRISDWSSDVCSSDLVSARLLRNASYAGHEKWTEPEPAKDLREYRVDLPAACDRRYLLRIRSKRFCFDQTDTAYGNADHLLYADVRCRLRRMPGVLSSLVRQVAPRASRPGELPHNDRPLLLPGTERCGGRYGLLSHGSGTETRH